MSLVRRARLSAQKNGSRETLFRPLKRAHKIGKHLANPRLKAGGYGSYAGFADKRRARQRAENGALASSPAGPAASRCRMGSLRRFRLLATFGAIARVGSETQPGQPAGTPAFRRATSERVS